MSGGAFDYSYSRVFQFADNLKSVLDSASTEGYCRYTPAVTAKLREIVDTARRCAALMKEAEWLYSGDTGENTFLDRVREIESAPQQPPPGYVLVPVHPQPEYFERLVGTSPACFTTQAQIQATAISWHRRIVSAAQETQP